MGRPVLLVALLSLFLVFGIGAYRPLSESYLYTYVPVHVYRDTVGHYKRLTAKEVGTFKALRVAAGDYEVYGYYRLGIKRTRWAPGPEYVLHKVTRREWHSLKSPR